MSSPPASKARKVTSSGSASSSACGVAAQSVTTSSSNTNAAAATLNGGNEHRPAGKRVATLEHVSNEVKKESERGETSESLNPSSLEGVMAMLGKGGGEDGTAMEILKKVMEGNLAGVPAGGEEAEDSEIVDDCRIIPEDFPSEYVAERESCIEVYVDGQEAPMRPDFMHQVFARDKYVLGHKNLKIKFQYTKKWRVFVSIQSEGDLKVAGSWSEDFLDKDLMGIIRKSPVCPLEDPENNFTDNIETFREWREEDDDSSEDEVCIEGPSYESLEVVPGSVKASGKLELLRCTALFKRAEGRSLLSRLQAMSVWWIESSEQTFANDSRWFLYMVFLGSKLVGFTTVFEFTNPIRMHRPHIWRICQAVVLPFAQKLGLGRLMIEKIYTQSREEARKVFEVNVEDPCLDFIRLRDSIETDLCLKYNVFPSSSEIPPRGIVPREDAELVRTSLRLTLKQVQRCYEIIRLGRLQAQEPSPTAALATFRLDTKRRIYDENLEDVQGRPKEELKSNLTLLYDDLLEQYLAVVKNASFT
mmetsp:Transcript_2526/g.4890  ORF Transcript_2526/g.4890 Transcript_2526/m.4890 type:complete len:531 (+) Transcript_2526:55-1647(+)